MTIPSAPLSDPLRDRLATALSPSYTVSGEIGRGGMSVVYRAHDVRLRRDVAIKILPPELAFVANVRERFMREAQTAAQLSHPNIVPIYGVEEKDSLVWIAMALIEGETLGQRLARDGRLTAPESQRILSSVADALVYAHAHGVIHRDIKPDNILLERGTLRVLVTDFGIARAAEGDSRLTLTGVAVGTPAYMSPEQAMGDGEIDGRSDLYSLGVVGYQMLAGAPPFTANSTPALLLKQVSEPLPPLKVRAPSAPSALVETIERALAKKPSDRWASLSAFADAVRNGRASAHMPAPVIGTPAITAPSAPAAAPQRHANVAPPRLSVEPRPPRDAERARPSIPVPPRPPVPLAGANAVPAWVYGVNAGSPSLDLHAQSFRRRFFRTVGMISFLGIINGLTSPQFGWVIFPAFGMLVGLSSRWRPLGDAGLSFVDVIQNHHAVRNAGIEGSVPAQLFTDSFAGRARRFASRFKTSIVSAGVSAVSLIVGSSLHIGPLAIPFAGGALLAVVSMVSALRAAAPLRAMGFRRRDLLNGTWRDSDAARSPSAAYRLREEEVSQPEMLPTANALVDRVASLAGALHQLDRDMGAASDDTLRLRIEELRARGVRDNEQTLALLLRQKSSLDELDLRRVTLRERLESASMRLQNLRLDVIRLGSAGLEVTAARDGGHATEQARALSKDLAYLIEGAREVDRL
jgi:serine/threonine protein kinase